MEINRALLNDFFNGLDERSGKALDSAVSKVVETKKKNGKVVVVTGSGPNIHEGVTTLIAELIDKGIIDGVTTSSAVVNHEMSGALDRVKMCDASQFGLDRARMPRGNVFEFTDLSEEETDILRKEMLLDEDLLKKGRSAGRQDGHKSRGQYGLSHGAED